MATRTQPQRVHNLNVETVHTYYVVAGGDAVLVHNCGTNSWKLPKDAGHHLTFAAQPVDRLSRTQIPALPRASNEAVNRLASEIEHAINCAT